MRGGQCEDAWAVRGRIEKQKTETVKLMMVEFRSPQMVGSGAAGELSEVVPSPFTMLAAQNDLAVAGGASWQGCHGKR